MLALVALLATAAATPPTATGAAWRTVAPGVEHLHLELGDTELIRLDLAKFRLEVRVPGPGNPIIAPRARFEGAGGGARATLAVNGGFFDTDGRSLGLRIGGGKVIQGLRKRVDWGVLTFRAAPSLGAPGRAAIIHSRDYQPDPTIAAALQVGPRILVAHQVPPLKPQASRRTAVAVDDSGRFVTIVVTRARVAATALGEALAGLGFADALLLDGGPSTQLSASVGDLDLEIEGGYAVPDVLVVLPLPSSS